MSSLIWLSNCSIAWLVNLYRLIISASLNWKSVIRMEKNISARCLCLCLRLALITAAISLGSFHTQSKHASWLRPAFMRTRIIPQIRDTLSPGSFSRPQYHGIRHQPHLTPLLPSLCGTHPLSLKPSQPRYSAFLCAAFVNTVLCPYPLFHA